MALTKVTYVDGVTVIGATNLNDIQDNVILNAADITGLGSTKVDKVEGKGLSQNDFTDALKTKLDGIEAGAQVNPGNATTSASGLMSAADKTKLNGIANGATNVTIDNTLTHSGQAADAKKTGDEVGALKSAIRYETTTVSTKYVSANSTVTGGTEMTTKGYVKPDGSYAGNNNYRCTSLLDLSGTSRSINAYCYGTENFLCFAFYDSDKQFISGIGGNSSSWTRISGAQTIPDTAKYVMVTMLVTDTGGYATVAVTTETSISDTVDEIDTRVDGLEGDVSTLKTSVAGIEDDLGHNTDIVVNIPIQSPTSGYMAKNGSTSSPSPTLAYTEKISCQPGDVFRFCNKYQGKAVTIRMVAAFSGDTINPDLGTNTETSVYTVPAGIDGVVITGYVATDGDASTLPYLYKWTKGEAPSAPNSGAFHAAGDLTDGESLFAPIVNIAKNRAATFTATITAFDAIKFGRSDYQNAIRIDGTNVELLDSSGQVDSTTAHGLTIANTISVRIYNTLAGGASKVVVCVSSNGTDATPIELTWRAYLSGKPFVKSDGSTLTDCSFSYAPYDINKKIWAFGDSYFGFSGERWMGILKNYGYTDNLLVNAYAGESSVQNLPAFLSLISIGRPKYALWADGMNDGNDRTSDPSAPWRNATLAFLTTCLSCGVIPILATIPTVPSVNNENKNAWVRDSGYRYIDFAKAVGAQSDGAWYSGMLSQDAVHPTPAGATALCNRALADFPELMQTS